jgi:GT2 family glycosyltransferase
MALERQRHTRLPREPLISLVVSVYRTPLAFLFAMLESIKAQTYQNWELFIVDGGSAAPVLRSVLESYRCHDERIHVEFLETDRGIAGNTNTGLELAAGEYVGLLDDRDTLAPFALFEIARALGFHTDADLVYSDEDRIDVTGCRRFEPFFKPAWSPDMLRSCNYVGHFAVYRRELLQELCGIRDGFDGAEYHDLALRVSERTRRISHIPQVLYHRRDCPAPAAPPAGETPAGVQCALTEHTRRLGWDAEVVADRTTGTCELRLSLPRRPLVSVLIPNKDAHDVLDTCLRSLWSATYENLEVLVIENNSVEPATFDCYRRLGCDPRVRVLTWPGRFNYGAIHNWAVPHARGEVLLLLNNDVAARHTDWIERLLEHALRDEVGAVGAKLFYPDGTIQHAGTTLSLDAPAAHTHRGWPGDSPGENGRLMMTGNRSAVTGACLMLRTEVFDVVGGFDERFAVNFNDVDLCLRIRQLDKLIVWTPFARLWHYESRTRGTFDPQTTLALWTQEAQLFREKWAEFLAAGDPYHNPNLSLTSGDCRVDPRGARPPHPRKASCWSGPALRRAA